MEERGRPVITTDVKVESGRIARLTLTQRDPDTGRGLAWTQTLQVALGYATGVRQLPVRLNATSVEVTAARGLPAPMFVLPNGGGLAVRRASPGTAASLAWLSTQLADIPNELTRGSAWT